MNKVFLIGNLTKDPELRTTQSGENVCSFTVAVNRRRSGENANQQVDYFRISAWRGLAEICSKFLAKGRKVAVTGRVSANAYMGNDNAPHASLEVMADDVEFLTPKSDSTEAQAYQQNAMVDTAEQKPKNLSEQSAGNSFVQVEDEDLPF